MVECWLPYGETEVHISVPLKEFQGVVEPKIGGVVRDLGSAVYKALRRPVGGEPLKDLVEEASSISIGLDGGMPRGVLLAALSALLGAVEAAGGLEGVRVIVGNCLRGDRLLLRALRDSLPGIDVLEHRAHSPCVELGKTSRGTVVRVSQPFMEGELRLILGEFHPDPLAGFKGPHSVILPQLSGFRTVEMDRRLYFQGSTGLGILEKNPILEDSRAALALAGVDASLLIVTDHRGGVVDLLYGDVEACWDRVLVEYHDLYSVDVDDANIYVVSPGGGRFDLDLYHSLLALRSLERPKRGSSILLVAECRGGLGAPALSRLSGVEKVRELRRRYMLGAEALQVLRSMQRTAKVLLVSALPRHLAEPLGLGVYAAANDAFEAVGGGRVLVLPYGLSITPRRG